MRSIATSALLVQVSNTCDSCLTGANTAVRYRRRRTAGRPPGTRLPPGRRSAHSTRMVATVDSSSTNGK